MLRLLFPPKCTLCRQLLTPQETDLCHKCRESAPIFTKSKRNIPFVAHWCAIWYYKDAVRESIRRFKFYNARSYADVYARFLAIKLDSDAFDVLSWIPVSFYRRLKRGYDQSELIANALGKELGKPVVRVLKKVRHTPPQSGIREPSKRRANILGAYRVTGTVRDQRILLVDDVVTTGATVSECAKTLLLAGAKDIQLAAVATATDNNTSR